MMAMQLPCHPEHSRGTSGLKDKRSEPTGEILTVRVSPRWARVRIKGWAVWAGSVSGRRPSSCLAGAASSGRARAGAPAP